MSLSRVQFAGENTSVNTRNTVIADNNIFGLRDCAGEIESSGGNFIGAANEECDIAEQASDILDGGAPGLGTLTNNGGPTRTMRPTSNSPLVDNGIWRLRTDRPAWVRVSGPARRRV